MPRRWSSTAPAHQGPATARDETARSLPCPHAVTCDELTADALRALLDQVDGVEPIRDSFVLAACAAVAADGDVAAMIERVLDTGTGSSTPASTTSTPVGLGDLLARLASPEPGQRVIDPLAGEGGLLLATARCAAGSIELAGRELDPWAWRLALVRLLCHQLPVDLGAGPSDVLAATSSPSCWRRCRVPTTRSSLPNASLTRCAGRSPWKASRWISAPAWGLPSPTTTGCGRRTCWLVC